MGCHAVPPVVHVARAHVSLEVREPEGRDAAAHVLPHQHGVQARVDVDGAGEGPEPQVQQVPPQLEVRVHHPLDVGGGEHQQRVLRVHPPRHHRRDEVPDVRVPEEPLLSRGGRKLEGPRHELVRGQAREHAVRGPPASVARELARGVRAHDLVEAEHRVVRIDGCPVGRPAQRGRVAHHGARGVSPPPQVLLRRLEGAPLRERLGLVQPRLPHEGLLRLHVPAHHRARRAVGHQAARLPHQHLDPGQGAGRGPNGPLGAGARFPGREARRQHPRPCQEPPPGRWPRPLLQPAVPREGVYALYRRRKQTPSSLRARERVRL
mmetsp:Transcript_49875/g.159493  ORF Transcript_49875/g.159493 Transcript_49875/m.159493 type:complete len:321 (-) Transcript_49875:228-1190(-)